MRVRFGWTLVIASLVLGFAASAFAQGSFFTSLSGTVVDSSGGVIPGANVKIKNTGTGEEFETVTGADGAFTVPSLPGGTYSVAVSLMGFRTATLNSVVLNAAVPASVKVTMQVGALEENVTVTGDSALVVQTQSPSIATNLTGTQIVSLPLTSRNALDSLTSLAGFNTSGTARNSTVAGMPKGTINITLDGMNIQDNYLKTSDGYFARLSPLLDSVEDVTVTMAGNTADATGQGGVQIKFVTKSGTNQWRGTTYEYFRHDALNANTWFNNRDLLPDPATGKAPKPQLRSYTQGIAQGGPIKSNKAFFFFNYEEQRSPASVTPQRVALTPDAATGVFTYNVGGGTRQVNLLQLAAANGQLSTLDPTVASSLAKIRTAMGSTGTITGLSNPLVQQYTFQTATTNFNPSPTMRLDYEINQKNRLTGSMNYRHINSTPDTTNNAQYSFPGLGATGSQQSTRWTTSESLRSTFTQNLVNEFRVGGTGGATLFSPELAASMFDVTGGYRLRFDTACCGSGFNLTNIASGVTANGTGTSSNSSREASTKVIEDTATWLRGKHSVQFGGSMVQADVWLQNQTIVPSITFGIQNTEAASAMFNTTNFPGASTQDITNATNLYAMLTGRITQIASEARINEAGDTYVPLGSSRAAGRLREFDVYGADQWRATNDLTISAGLRYVLANPFYPVNNSYTTATTASMCGVTGLGGVGGCNLFAPGSLTGSKPTYIQLPAGTYAYNPDRNNLAPSAGAAWQVPGAGSGLSHLLFGSEDGDSVVRGGWAMAYSRPGMSDFTGVFGANQGIAVTLNRDAATGNLGTLPVLLRNPSQLTPPAAPAAIYPQVPNNITNTINAFDSNLQMPWAQTWTVGWQRKLGRDTAFELRYVGSRHRQDWETVNLNEISITDNGFMQEFRKAQANLQANIAAGRGNTFAYTGAAGTAPLPIFLAFFSGLPSSQAGDATKYNSAQFTNATNLNFLAAMNPNPFGFASVNSTSGFVGNATFRNNGLTAGLPANFFLANPDVIGTGNGGSNLTTNSGGTNAKSIVFEVRKRLTNGVSYNASYTWSNATIFQRYGFQRPDAELDQVGQVGNVQHAFKMNWLYDLPFGRDQKFGSSAKGWLDGLIGGWSIDGVARIQTGEMLDFGNVRLVGMSVDDFRKALDLRVASNGQLYILPDDILQNTVKAFNVSPTSANGYSALGAPTGRYLAPANGPDCIESSLNAGDCGIRSLVVNGPQLYRFDLGASKRVRIHNDVTFEFRAELLNAFNKPYFNPANTAGTPLGMSTTFTAPGGPFLTGTPTANTSAGSSVDSFRLTALLGDNTSRQGQLIFRLRW
jgi:hypothetical protein